MDFACGGNLPISPFYSIFAALPQLLRASPDSPVLLDQKIPMPWPTLGHSNILSVYYICLSLGQNRDCDIRVENGNNTKTCKNKCTERKAHPQARWAKVWIFVCHQGNLHGSGKYSAFLFPKSVTEGIKQEGSVGRKNRTRQKKPYMIMKGN